MQQTVKPVTRLSKNRGGLAELARVRAIEIPVILPDLPEPLRTFAQEYATTVYRTIREWAEKYKRNPETIRRWLKREDVVKYILKLRYDRISRHKEKLKTIEDKALSRFEQILDMPLSDDNVASTLKAVMLALGLDSVGKSGPNVNILNVTKEDANKEITALPDDTSSETVKRLEAELAKWKTHTES